MTRPSIEASCAIFVLPEISKSSTQAAPPSAPRASILSGGCNGNNKRAVPTRRSLLFSYLPACALRSSSWRHLATRQTFSSYLLCQCFFIQTRINILSPRRINAISGSDIFPYRATSSHEVSLMFTMVGGDVAS